MEQTVKPTSLLVSRSPAYRLYIGAQMRVRSFRDFKRSWFVEHKRSPVLPNANHIRAINSKFAALRLDLELVLDRLRSMSRTEGFDDYSQLVNQKYKVDRRLGSAQHLWDFFFDLFTQRRSIMASRLEGCDRVVGECYRTVFSKLTISSPWTKTPPVCYVDKGTSPATIRRGVRFLKKQSLMVGNPFPVVKIPYDRLATPWSLTSLAHEASHDIHGDVPGLWRATKVAVYRAVRKAGFSQNLARIWAYWHKETLADLLSILLAGPASVWMLMDIMSKPRQLVMKYRQRDTHPIPYLRVLICISALRRMGFTDEARAIEQQWQRRYPLSSDHNMPSELIDSASRVIPLVVNTILWQTYSQLGDNGLVQIVNYSRGDHRRVLNAVPALMVGRLRSGLPLRHRISVAVYAFRKRPDAAQIIRKSLYRWLDASRTRPVESTVVTVPIPIQRNTFTLRPRWFRRRRKLVVLGRLRRGLSSLRRRRRLLAKSARPRPIKRRITVRPKPQVLTGRIRQGRLAGALGRRRNPRRHPMRRKTIVNKVRPAVARKARRAKLRRAA